MSSSLYSDHVTAMNVGAESVRIIKQSFHNEVEKTAAPWDRWEKQHHLPPSHTLQQGPMAGQSYLHTQVQTC